MPYKEVVEEGKHYIQWGNRGHLYPFKPNSAKSRQRACSLAGAQAKAAYSRGYKGKPHPKNYKNPCK